MKHIIKKILTENRISLVISNEFKEKSNERASLYSIAPEDWYLGSQILYKYKMQSGCVVYGSSDLEVAEKYALFDTENYSVKSDGYRFYCNAIKDYYNLDNFKIPKTEKAIYAFLDRYVSLVIFDSYQESDSINYLEYIENPDSLHVGYEFNDEDEGGDIGIFRNTLTHNMMKTFMMPYRDIDKYLINWVANKIATDVFTMV